jgi:hypothetical protein
MKLAFNRNTASALQSKFSPMFFAVLLVSLAGVPMVQGSTGTTACTEAKLQQSLQTAVPGTTAAEALGFVENSAPYAAATAGFNTTLGGSTQGWTFDKSNCDVTWQSINVIFLLRASNGSRYDLSITSNPALGIIYSSNITPIVDNSGITPTCSGTCHWSGYALGSNSGQTNQVYGSDLRWYQEAVSVPPSPQPNCTNSWCDMSTWSGVSNSSDVSGCPCIVQAGTTGQVEGTTPVYWAWLEMLGSSVNSGDPMPCPSTETVSTGDLMESQTDNQYAEGGGSGNGYYLYVYDWSNTWICNLGNVGVSAPASFSFTPHWADFIAENNAGYVIPNFQQINFTDAEMYNTAWNYVYNDWNSGWGIGVFNHVGGYNNAYVTGMDTTSEGFEVSWVQSYGT